MPRYDMTATDLYLSTYDFNVDLYIWAGDISLALSEKWKRAKYLENN